MIISVHDMPLSQEGKLQIQGGIYAALQLLVCHNKESLREGTSMNHLHVSKYHRFSSRAPMQVLVRTSI